MIEPVHVPIASVRLGGRRDRNDDVVPDLRDERRRLRRQAVGELHQHFGRARLAAVETAHEVIVRLGVRNEVVHLRVGQTARVCELREVVPIVLEVLEVLLGRHPDDHELASLVRLHRQRFDLHARRRLGERAIVLQNVGVVRELGRRADVVAEHVLGRRDAGDERQVVDERASIPRLAGPLRIRLGELGILLLARVAGLVHRLLRAEPRGGKTDDRGGKRTRAERREGTAEPPTGVGHNEASGAWRLEGERSGCVRRRTIRSVHAVD